jgi:hypothetical protein
MIHASLIRWFHSRVYVVLILGFTMPISHDWFFADGFRGVDFFTWDR